VGSRGQVGRVALRRDVLLERGGLRRALRLGQLLHGRSREARGRLRANGADRILGLMEAATKAAWRADFSRNRGTTSAAFSAVMTLASSITEEKAEVSVPEPFFDCRVLLDELRT
jgi:hypothetical protein